MENIEKYPSINSIKDLESYLNLILDIDTNYENQIWMHNEFVDTKKVSVENIKTELFNELKSQIGNIRISTKHSQIPLDNVNSLNILYEKVMLWIRLVILTSTYDVKVAVISYDDNFVSMKMIVTGNFKNMERERFHMVKPQVFYDKTNDLSIEMKDER